MLRRADEAGADVVELVEVAVPDAQGAALAGARLDLHLEAERIAQVLLEGARVGVLVVNHPTARPGRGAAALLGLYDGLHGAHVEILLDDAASERIGVVAPDQRARMALGQAAVLQQSLHRRR